MTKPTKTEIVRAHIDAATGPISLREALAHARELLDDRLPLHEDCRYCRAIKKLTKQEPLLCPSCSEPGDDDTAPVHKVCAGVEFAARCARCRCPAHLVD